MNRWLLTPFKDNGRLTPAQLRYNGKHSGTRQSVERAIGLLKERCWRNVSDHNSCMCSTQRLPFSWWRWHWTSFSWWRWHWKFRETSVSWQWWWWRWQWSPTSSCSPGYCKEKPDSKLFELITFKLNWSHMLNKLQMALSCLYSYWHTLDAIKCSKRNHERSEWFHCQVLDILWRQVCVNKSIYTQLKTIWNLFFTITKSKKKSKNKGKWKRLKEKLFQARAGSVRERLVIRCVCTLIDNGWEPIRLRDYALLL